MVCGLNDIQYNVTVVVLRGGGGGSPLKFWKTRFRDNG